MRMFVGSVFALIIVSAILIVAVDVETMTIRHISLREFVPVLMLGGFGILGFVLITGKGMGKGPKPSKYY